MTDHLKLYKETNETLTKIADTLYNNLVDEKVAGMSRTHYILDDIYSAMATCKEIITNLESESED